MIKIKIDKGVPMPMIRGRGAKYPWLQMAVGDSFLSDVSATSAGRNACVAAKRAGDGRKFAVRTTPEGVRVWRVS